LAEVALAKEVGLPGAVDAAESNVVFVLIRLRRFAEAAERAVRCWPASMRARAPQTPTCPGCYGV